MRATNRIFIGSILVLFVSTLGPALRTVNWPYPLTGLWPVAGLWADIAWSGGYMSVRAALALVFLGLYQDFLHEAPLGAWPLAFLSAYAAGMSAHKLLPARNDYMTAVVFALIIGFVGAFIGLVVARGVSDSPAVLSRDLISDMVLTGMLYFLARPLLSGDGTLEEAT